LKSWDRFYRDGDRGLYISSLDVVGALSRDLTGEAAHHPGCDPSYPKPG
jgi:hypothetical protein